MNGLVLTAGGARGAYQAGVLKRMGEIRAFRGKPSPFPIITGASAGAINGAALAAGSWDFGATTERLAKLWENIDFKHVFYTDALSMGRGGLRWLKDLTLGGLIGGGGAQSLLDFTPLRGFLQKNLPLEGIARGIEKGHLYALGVTATNYYSGKSYTFIQGKKGHPAWIKSRRVAIPLNIGVDHIWASCSIPVVFQPVKLSLETGEFYFGDGGLRLVTPLSPAIRLGAKKVFAIGIRSQESAKARLKVELMETSTARPTMKRPPIAQVFGVTLNAIFLDHLDTDLEHLTRMNELLHSYGVGKNDQSKTREPMRAIGSFVVNPSVDLGSVAEKYIHKMPGIVRYFMEGLGTSKAQSSDLASYLIFDTEYTKALIDIGYHDAGNCLAAIEEFLTTA